MGWDDTYETVLRSYADLLDDDEALSSDHTLLSLGLDSLMLVQLVVELEERYELTFPDDVFVEETFETVGSFWRAVEGAIVGSDVARLD